MTTICRKPCFWDPHARRGKSQCVLGPCLRVGCAHTARAVGGSQNDALSAGSRCMTPRVGGDRWSSCTGLVAAGGCAVAWAHVGPSGSVNDSGAESYMCGRLGWCGVWWLFQGCCSGGCLGRSAPTAWGEGGFRNVPNYAYTQDGQELGASAGACRAGSLAGARFRPLSAPPRTLVCTSA